MIHFVMMQTTMLNAILIMELVVTNPGQCGTTSALIVNVSKSNTKRTTSIDDDIEKHVLYQ